MNETSVKSYLDKHFSLFSLSVRHVAISSPDISVDGWSQTLNLGMMRQALNHCHQRMLSRIFKSLRANASERNIQPWANPIKLFTAIIYGFL
jgi:hypothetical protein